jgi:uncharacterized membrane protein
MNWRAWLQGLISAVSTGILTGLGTTSIIPGKTTFKELGMICLIPTIISFFMYLKQTPPPIGARGETK